ncbi:MAG: sulfatase-like hydrolase/transferase [Nitriliruptorales bacterium]|nr:sulfatase-like hydrolase/transferase [Nitriliruptorales bacterium]
MSRFPVHPLFFAGFPALALWSANRTEVTWGDVWPVLGVTLATATVLTLLSAVALKDMRRGAIVASHLAVLLLTFGTVWSSPWVAGVLVTTGIIVAVVFLAIRVTDEAASTWSVALNVIGLVLVLVNGVPPMLGSSTRTLVALDDDARPITVADDAPDIVWIIPDRYGRQDALEELFGFDNSPFLEGLEERGFTVLDEALANYNKTAHSMASTLNLEYLDELAAAVPDDQSGDWGPLYAMLTDHEVGRVLTAAGYEYIHIGNWWDPTATAAAADLVLNWDDSSEFAQVFRDGTIWPALGGLVGDDQVDTRTRIRNHTLYGFDQLDRLAAHDSDRPRFILAHLTIPHEPYVFAADGSFVTAAQARQRSRAVNVSEQVRYANHRLERIVDRFLDRPPGEHPVIIIQADEGTHPPNYEIDQGGYDWFAAPDVELAEKLRILSAWYVPEHVDVSPWPSMTPINTFRLLLDEIVGTSLGPLEDRVVIFRDASHLYEFRDVTDRMRAYRPPSG